MGKNRIRISGQVHNDHQQIIELSDKELVELLNQINIARKKGHQAIDDFLGDNYADTEPIDWQYYEWSAELIDDKDLVIEYLDS